MVILHVFPSPLPVYSPVSSADSHFFFYIFQNLFNSFSPFFQVSNSFLLDFALDFNRHRYHVVGLVFLF